MRLQSPKIQYQATNFKDQKFFSHVVVVVAAVVVIVVVGDAVEHRGRREVLLDRGRRDQAWGGVL